MPNVFPLIINWTSPFPILGLLVGIFHQILKETSVSKHQTSRFVAADLVLHCLPMKKDARLIWVKPKSDNYDEIQS